MSRGEVELYKLLAISFQMIIRQEKILITPLKTGR